MDFNLQEAGDLTYHDNKAFRVMLDVIGVDLDQRNRLTNDGFDSMKAIIDLHSNDVEGFKKYLINLNKTFGARGFQFGYIVDDTIRPVTSPEQPVVEVDTIDINDDEAYTTLSTHFGRGFKSDNKAV